MVVHWLGFQFSDCSRFTVLVTKLCSVMHIEQETAKKYD